MFYNPRLKPNENVITPKRASVKAEKLSEK